MNCPLCRAPIKTTSESGRYVTCFNGHETNIKSVLSCVLPIVPGWLCWQTRSNSGVSEIRYAYVGAKQTAAFKKYDEAGDDEVGQYLIDNYEDWMNHAYHGASIDWELDCAVPIHVIRAKLASAKLSVRNAQDREQELSELLIKLSETIDSVLPE